MKTEKTQDHVHERLLTALQGPEDSPSGILSDCFWCPTFKRVTGISECIWRQNNSSYRACEGCNLGQHWKNIYCTPRKFKAKEHPWRTRRPRSGTRILELMKGDIFEIAGQEWIVTKKLPGGKLLMRPLAEVSEGKHER